MNFHSFKLARAIAALVLTCAAAACTPASAPERRYVVTVHPLQAILSELTAGRAEVSKLLPAGASPHTYDPRPSDARRAATATAVLYVSPLLDAWAMRFDARRRVEVLSLLPREAIQRFPVQDPKLEAAADHAHEAGELDPHFWTDPQAVAALLPGLTKALCEADAAGCGAYETNAARFAAELEALDREIAAALAGVRGAPVVLGHPFLLYYMKRYGLELAAVAESSPGKEPTPRFVQELVHVAHRAGARAVFVQEQLPYRAAQLLAEASGLPLVVLDPLGGVEGRMRYVELMRFNTRRIVEALR